MKPPRSGGEALFNFATGASRASYSTVHAVMLVKTQNGRSSIERVKVQSMEHGDEFEAVEGHEVKRKWRIGRRARKLTQRRGRRDNFWGD